MATPLSRAWLIAVPVSLSRGPGGVRDDPTGVVGTRARAESAPSLWVTLLVSVVVITAAFTVFVEWGHYADRFRWILWTKSLGLLTAPLSLAGLLVWGHRRRAAWTWLTAALVGIMAWLTLDLQVHDGLGTHLTEYLLFIPRSDYSAIGALHWGVWPIVWGGRGCSRASERGASNGSGEACRRAGGGPTPAAACSASAPVMSPPS